MACSSVKVLMLRTAKKKTTSQLGTQHEGQSRCLRGSWQQTGCEAGDLLVRGVLYLMLMSLFSRCRSMASCKRLRPCMKGSIVMGSPVAKHGLVREGGVRNQCEEREGRFRGEHM